MIPDLVGKGRSINAVGLNAAFNGAAVVGLALAGVILGTFGPAACFVLSAASYLAVIVALLAIRTRSVGWDAGDMNLAEGIGTGLRFVGRCRPVLALFALAAIISLELPRCDRRLSMGRTGRGLP